MTMNKDTLYVKRKRPTDMLLLAAIYVSATLAVALLLGIILYVFVKGIRTVNWAFLTTVTSARKQTTGIAGKHCAPCRTVIVPVRWEWDPRNGI